MIDFLLKARSKPESYKRENQKVIIDADRENEKKKQRENPQTQQQQERSILVAGNSILTEISGISGFK